MHGGDMTQTDDFTLSLLTNDEVLAVNQYSTHNRQLFRNVRPVAWVADVRELQRQIPRRLQHQRWHRSSVRVPVDLGTIGLAAPVKVRDLWAGKNLDAKTLDFAPEVPPHGARLFRLRAGQ